MEYIAYLEYIWAKLLSILHTLTGWVMAIVLFLLDFIAGHEIAVGLVVVVTIIDN